MGTSGRGGTESGGPGGRSPSPEPRSSLLTPASPSPCFSSSCSMFVVPGAAGSNWPPPQGADAVWSKSAGRLLMGDLGSEGNTGLRLNLPLPSPPLLPSPPQGFQSPASEPHPLLVPASPPLLPEGPSGPAPSASLTWKTDSPEGRSPDTGSCSPPGLALGRRREAGVSGGRMPVGRSVPAGKWARDLEPYGRPLPPGPPNPSSSSEAAGSPGMETRPLGGKATDLVSSLL